MQNCGEDVTEIDVKPDGSWRAKNENDHRDLAQWHFPDGSLCITTEVDMKPDQETLRQIKQGVSDGQTGLKLGIKRNSNGIWEVSKPEDMRASSSGNHVTDKFGSHCQKVVPMSSSATGSYRDGEDASVNQEGGGHFDFSTNNNELDSISRNFDPSYSNLNRISSTLMDEEIIVLTDSEDDVNVNIISPEAVYVVGPAGDNPFPVPTHGVIDSYPEDSGLGANGTGLDLFNANGNDFEIPMWPPLPSCQVAPGFPLFGTETNDSDGLVDAQGTSAPCPTTMNGFGLAPDTNFIHDTSQDQNLSICPPNIEINGGLVDNPLAFDDPSLQIFLPTGPMGASVQANMSEHTEASNAGRTDDLLSLRLGGGGCHDGESPATDGLHSRNQFPTKETRIDSVANSGAFLYAIDS